MAGETSRRNGRQGRGPVPHEGRARSAGNARKHGLSQPLRADHPELAQGLRDVAQALVGESEWASDPALRRAARRLALADLAVRRVRAHLQAVQDGFLNEQKRLALLLDVLGEDRRHLAAFVETEAERDALLLCGEEAARILSVEVLGAGALGADALAGTPVALRALLASEGLRALLAGSAERLSLERSAERAQSAFQKALRDLAEARQAAGASAPGRWRAGH